MRRLFEVLFIIFLLSCSCSKEEQGKFPYSDVSTENFKANQNDEYKISIQRLWWYIDSLRTSQRDTNYVDLLTNKYYAEKRPLLWINRMGSDQRADTLLHWLSDVKKMGFEEEKFYLNEINENLQRLQRLDFDQNHPISRTLASLEYYLTKSFLRYSSGQRFGFTNPKRILNYLEVREPDEPKSPFKELFDIRMDYFTKDFVDVAFKALQNYQLDPFLKAVQPQSELYAQLLKELQNDTLTDEQRKTLIVNLERSRWRIQEEKGNKYVLINLPSQQLTAFDEKEEPLSMKICCGSVGHKTPQLTSQISHLELNPYWVIPFSIVKREVSVHAGDTAYFNKHRYKIIEKSTGDFALTEDITRGMLLSGKYLIRQDQGEDNSLGRMIFRFPNAFSIYLHHTNLKSAFNRSYRLLSHGCIRLEKPFELATYLLKDKNDVYIDKLRLSLDMTPQTEEGKMLKERGNFEPLKRCDYNPAIPLFIVYFTCYPDPTGKLIYYPDLYRYDELFLKRLAPIRLKA